MTSNKSFHQLSLIGYWSDKSQPIYDSCGWPDPQDLIGEWDADDLRKTLVHLRRGEVFRSFLGQSSCRICGQELGCTESTDGVWAWPDGLDHYVKEHRILLPEPFLARCRLPGQELPSWLNDLGYSVWIESGGPARPLLPINEPLWVVDDTVWLDWAAANTPARPADDAITLDEARKLCIKLLQPDIQLSVDEIFGRWRVNIEIDPDIKKNLYVQKCSNTFFLKCLFNRLFDIVTNNQNTPAEVLSQFAEIYKIIGEDGSEYGEESPEIIRFVNKILLNAIKENATEIHLEHYQNEIIVKFMINNELIEITKPSEKIWKGTIGRIKLMFNLKDNGTKEPTYGHLLLKLSKSKSINFHIKINPDPELDNKVVIINEGEI